LQDVVKPHPKWDGRVCGLQVTETYVDHIEARCLVSARDAGAAFDLRCDVREAMMAYLRDAMPEALPRWRNQIVGETRPEPAPALPPAAHR